VDTEHLCCIAHARAKFKYTNEQARFFLKKMSKFYKLEGGSRKENLTLNRSKPVEPMLKQNSLLNVCETRCLTCWNKPRKFR
jgi:hypothetical protein